MFHAQDLLHGLSGLRLAHPIYLYQHLGSTNDQARQFAQAGAPEGLLVVAEEQTAGRGRGGRRWLTPPGSALALSLVLRPRLSAERAARATMLAGLATCQAVEHVAGLRAELKWPNDLLIRGRKAAGILSESALSGEHVDFIILGIGINVSWAPAPEEVDFPATCLEAEAGAPIDRLRLLRALLERLEAGYGHLAVTDEAAPDVLFEGWRTRLALLGTSVVLRMENEALAGRVEGVAPDGALLFRSDSGQTRRVLAGDVHLRPA